MDRYTWPPGRAWCLPSPESELIKCRGRQLAGDCIPSHRPERLSLVRSGGGRRKIQARLQFARVRESYSELPPVASSLDLWPPASFLCTLTVALCTS
ncbi:uncharacterized protein LAESUDRAFT_413124 [Laetiporus sulphureus 93-53]|uniref:Uncharacterized protein n=1 Tax=Laetiporus sulphureus 93-53 TaxID=1314785 RepID=A0A165C779_9APHY|nr:uncharacterized protein LAESUDRAFT_413124 [Laetiporus sulphureus 93-53]KZT02321.1 hypothetical protein LAESUDRAFT_413124 [Laetiporus sulphureus 93-53]